MCFAEACEACENEAKVQKLMAYFVSDSLVQKAESSASKVTLEKGFL